MKHILVQYIDLLNEKEELEKRIRKLQAKRDKINSDGNVRDVVKGGEGGLQRYHIEGYPVEDEDEILYLIEKNIRILKQREYDIQETVLDVEKYISTINDSRMRRMITKKYIEGKTWYQVANEMGQLYTKDSCQKQMERFLKKEINKKMS